MRVDPHDEWSGKQNRRVVLAVSELLECRYKYMKLLLTGFLSKCGKMVHKDRGHQHPEHICAKILHRMGLVSEKLEDKVINAN